MKKLLFVLQYILKPRTVGAVLPSSKYLANKMIENIDFNNAKYIVEYGPGTGAFTKKLLEKRNKDTVIILVEYNNKFCNLIMDKCKDQENLIIINDSAENIDKHLEKYNIPYVDYVISGLPFASLPRLTSQLILNKTKKILKENGKFITFQYTLLKKDFINNYFNKIHIKREIKNIPPAYVFSCNN